MCAITGNVETYNPATHKVETRSTNDLVAHPVKVESRQLDDVLSNLARTNAEVSVLGSIPEHAKPAWLKVFERDPEYKEKLQAASYMTGLLPQLREAEKDGDLIRAAQLLGSYDAVSRWAENALSGDEADYMERLRRRLDKAGVEIIPSPVNKPFTGDTPDLRATSAFHDDALFPGETIVAACTAAGVRRRVIGMDPIVTPAQVTLASHTVQNPELQYGGRTFTPARVIVDRESRTVRIFTDQPINEDNSLLGTQSDGKIYETRISIRAYDRMLRRSGWEYTLDEKTGRRIWLRPELPEETAQAIEKETQNPETKPDQPAAEGNPETPETKPAENNRDSLGSPDSPAPRETPETPKPAEPDTNNIDNTPPAEPEAPAEPKQPAAPIELQQGKDSVVINGQEAPIMFINEDGSIELLSYLPINENSVEENGAYTTIFPSREALEETAEHGPDSSLRVIRDGMELVPQDRARAPKQPERSDPARPVDESKESEQSTGKHKGGYALSPEIDENGVQFVMAPSGGIEFGRVPEDSSLTSAPILLSEGIITNPDTNAGYGLVHIEARHGEEIRSNGYDSVIDFIQYVARNYTEIRKGNVRNGQQTYRMQLLDGHNNMLMIELSGDGTYWNINTAGIFKTSYGKKNEVVYTRHTTDTRPAETGGESQDATQRGTIASSRMNSPAPSSDRKVNTKSPDTQTRAEETAAKTSETPRLQERPEAEPTDVRGLRDGADRAQRDIDALEKQIESHRAKEPSRLSAGTSYEEKHAKWQQKMDELQDQLPPLRELVLKWRAKADQLEEEQRQAEEQRIIAEGGIPEDAEGNWQFHKVTPEHTYRFLTERQGYASDDVIATADANIDAKEPKKPKLGANAKANAEKLQDYNRRLEEFNRNREYWQQVKEIAVRDKAEAEKAAEAARAEEIRRQEEERRRAEEEAARRGAEKGVGPEITGRWNGAEKIQGRDDAIITPSGRTIRGRYVLVEEGAATPSHDPENGFAKSPGFPVDKNGNTVNDRDYERDHAAQQYVHRVAAGYDGRAVQDPVIVSRDGVVLSGNNRTMSGRIAARDNTDGKYTAHLEATAAKYGFTAEQVRSMKHPRLYFETEENLPYTAETFALFNKTEKKEMNVTERSVKLGKTISGGVFNRMAREMDAYETFAEYARSPEAVQAIKDLHAAGVIETAELPRYYDEQSGAITPEGISLLQGALIGHVFNENPDVVRMAMEHPAVRDSILKALVMLAENSRFSPEYSLIGDISRAIEIYHKGKEAGFRTVSESVLQHSLLEELDIPETTALVIADLLNGGKTTRLQKFLKEYNAEARLADAGQLDIFSENAEPTPASEIRRQVYETLGINPKQYERYEKLRNNGKPDEPNDPEGPNGPEGPGGNAPEPNGPQGGKPGGGGEPPQTPARPAGGAPQPGGPQPGDSADPRITLRQRDGETSYQISRHDVLEAAGRPRGMFDVAKTASHWHFGGLYDSDGRGSFLFPDSERAEAFLKAAEQYPGDPQAFEKAARELAERRDDGLFHKGEKYTVGEEKTTLEILSPRSLRGDYEVSVDGHKGIFKESQLQKILKPETLPEQPDTETASEPTQGYGNSPLPNFMQAVRALYQKGKKAAAQLFQMSFFDVTKTPEFMKVLGLKGEKFTIRFGVISRHFGKDSDHKLPEDIWEQLPEALQRPFAISKHFEEKNGEKKQKGYRIYTTLKHNDRYVIVGAEVKNIGRNLEINAIETAFAIKKPSESEDFIYTSETITPEQQSLLNGRNSRQYPVAQGLSADKGTTNSTTGQTNSENSAETASEPAAGRRQRGPELTPSLFGPAQPRHRAERTPSLFRFKTESEPQEAESKAGSVRERQSDKADKPAESELTEEQQQSADRANAAIDRYVDAFAEHIERTKDIPDDIPDDISAPFYDARDRALDAIADHYRALGNTEADARRMARDQLTTVTAEASVRLNRKPATLPAEEGVPYRPAEKTEAGPDAKAYRSASGEVIEYSSSDGLPRKEQGEFALVERKFVADGYFGFTGSETVETADDVAYLFRQLENHATEHAFVLLVKDGRPTVVHIGQGSFDVTLVNFGAIRAANDALGGADGIYFVHNHPSGNLTASGPDLNIMHTIERMFPKKALGIIIDTTSGKYLQFSAIGLDSETARPDQARGAEKPYTVNNFDRQVFSPEYDFGTLRQIRDESDVAAYVSTLRLGARDKISFLVLDRANKVTGNFHTDFDRHSDQEEMADMMIRQALRFGGTSVIMYGNEKALRPERAVRDAFSAQMKDIFKRKSGDSVRFLDNVSVKNGLDSSGQSASEPAPTYGTDKNEAGRSEAALKHLEPSSTGNDAAKVLKDVETSYDSGKFLLEESEKASNSSLVRFRDGETPLSGAEPAAAERDLVAVHNLTEENLADALGLGGFPMPSVAVTKAGMEHKDYGPVSLVFGRETIDPARRGNKVYSGDAWTPVFPETGYKLNGKKTNEIYGRANGAGALPLFKPTDFHPDNYERRIDRRGDRSLMESFRDSYSAKQLFLSEKGNPVTEMVRTRVEKYTPGRITLLEDIVRTIGAERLISGSDEKLAPEVRGLIEKHDPSALEGKKPFVVKAKINNAILEAVDYAENGNIAVKADTDATRAEIDKRVNQKEFETWLSDIFSGVVEKRGIRNERDPFTPSGSSRPWEALYDEITLDNVVRAMRRQADKGGQGFFGSSIFGASTRELRDIDDVRREAAARISSVPREEYEAEKKQIVERLSKVTLPSVAGDFSRAMDFVENVNEAVAKSHGADGIYRHLKGIYPDMTRAVAEEIGGIVADIQKMATRYLEAKPRRGVGLGEVRLAVVPEGTAPEVVRQLESRGIPVRTYEPGNERQRADIISRETADRGLRFRRQIAEVQKRDSGAVPTPREARAAVPVLDLAVRDTRARFDAAGDPSERRELQEQLDQLLEEQDAYATGRAPQTPEQRANVRRAAETAAAALGEKVIIHTTATGITHPDAAVRARMRRAKGWYDAATGEVHINAFNHATEADAARTMLHESIGHKALRDFYGDRFDNFLDEIYSSAEEPIRRQIASRMGSNGWNVREATEEYMATLAETVDRHGAEHLDTATRRTWQRTKTAVKRTLNRILEKAGLTTRVSLSDRDLSYLLWRQYRSRRKAGALEAAENQTRLEALRRDPESFAAEVGFREEQKNPTWKETSYALTDSLTDSPLPHQEGAGLDSQSKSDAAKVQRISGNLQTFAEKIPKKGLGKNELIYSLAASLGIERADSGRSNYLELNINGVGETTIRISNHSAEMDNFGKTDNNVGIVIKTSNRRFRNNPDKNYVEFMYYGDKTEGNAERQRQIAEGLRHYIETGSFEQMPEPDRLNTSGAYRRAIDAINGGKAIRFRDGDREAAADPATAEETRSRRIFDLMVDMCNRNKDNVEYRDAARKTLTGRLATVARGMRLQRDFDRAQLAAVTDTCNKMIGLEILDTESRTDMARTIKAIGGSAGKEDLEDTAYRLLGIASHSQVRMARRRLDDLSKIRGTKTGDDRIQRQAGLDPEGQATAKAFRDFRKLPEQNIQTAMARVSERIAGDDVPESASMLAAAEMLGLRQALLHSQEDALHRDNLAGIEDALRDLKNQWDPSLSGEERRRYRQARKSLGQQRIVEELRHADALGAIADSMGETLQASKERVRIFREAEKERVNNIHHDANCDMQGRPAHADRPARSKLVNNTVTSFFLAPTMTFDQMLRMFGKHSANGEGYLYYRFMSGPQGWQACEDRRFKSKQAKERILDRKAAEILGKDKAHWADLYKLTRAEGCTLTYNSAGVEVERKVSQGNLMYIYMANKMTDGAVKLRHMNITEEDMDLVEEVLDPRLRQLADWIQDEFLPSTRDGYNDVHIRMFGAPMDYVENYFPLKITEGEIQKNVEIGEMMNDGEGDTPKILTGAIRKRVFNTRALNILDSDPVAITLEHLEEMEDWAAFSEFRRDLGTLLSYRRFKNQVKNTTSVYGAGEKLWKRFGEVAQLTGGADQGMRSGMVGEVDKAVVNLCKLGTASRITYRVFTALKQFTSLPAFGSDVNLWNAIHSTATPRASWRWCMENLPSFEKRWVTRQAGNDILRSWQGDWDIFRKKGLEAIQRAGLSPNPNIASLVKSCIQLLRYSLFAFFAACSASKPSRSICLAMNSSVRLL